MDKQTSVSYALPEAKIGKDTGTLGKAAKSLAPLLRDERGNLIVALIAMLTNALATLVAPFIIAHAVDSYIANRNMSGVIISALALLVVYAVVFASGFLQTRRMGGVGRRVLFKLRNALFYRIQELPIAFFNENKVGDLVSRINNDTDKLNQFFGQALMQFVGSIFLIGGAGIFLVALNWRLGLAALAPAALVFVVTQLISGWVKRKSRAGLQSLGSMSAEIQESLDNFKVIVAFNRLDYFREKFKEANDVNYDASVGSGIASGLFTPLYGLASNLGQLTVLSFGLYLILTGHFTIGLLIGYILYVNSFYNPLRQLANVWSSLQLALASLDRIQDVLSLKSNLEVVSEAFLKNASGILAFDGVSFHYPGGKPVLHDVSFKLEKGKTYALVGPTGGGKTTTASLMARLFDPTDGAVYLDGKDIRSYPFEERTKKVGFILQEPFLFSGTVRENLMYGNEKYVGVSDSELMEALRQAHLTKLIDRFDDGLDTKVSTTGGSLSLGQKQLIAFMRATLRNPEILILDEATANIDTVTEQLLEDILAELPASTTKVIIAHRLNTISSADEIFFVNSGTLTRAGSMEHAVELLLHGKRES